MRRSSLVVSRLTCSMSASAFARSVSPSGPAVLPAAAARTVMSPSPCETRSCRSRAIRSRSAWVACSAAQADSLSS